MLEIITYPDDPVDNCGEYTPNFAYVASVLVLGCEPKNAIHFYLDNDGEWHTAVTERVWKLVSPGSTFTGFSFAPWSEDVPVIESKYPEWIQAFEAIETGQRSGLVNLNVFDFTQRIDLWE